LRVPERPNLPGTTVERPNWSLALPAPIDDLELDPVVAQIAEALSRQGD
jgi:4-alpha-glucanotransferase